jgi:hypothetical protein
MPTVTLVRPQQGPSEGELVLPGNVSAFYADPLQNGVVCSIIMKTTLLSWLPCTYRYWRSSTSVIDKSGVSVHDTESVRRLQDADGACRGDVGRHHGHRLRTRASSFPRRSNLRRQCEPTIGPLAPGPRPFQSLWNARPPRPGRQSSPPRRSRQHDTVIKDTAKAGLGPVAVFANRWRIWDRRGSLEKSVSAVRALLQSVHHRLKFCPAAPESSEARSVIEMLHSRSHSSCRRPA